MAQLDASGTNIIALWALWSLIVCPWNGYLFSSFNLRYLEMFRVIWNDGWIDGTFKGWNEYGLKFHHLNELYCSRYWLTKSQRNHKGDPWQSIKSSQWKKFQQIFSFLSFVLIMIHFYIVHSHWWHRDIEWTHLELGCKQKCCKTINDFTSFKHI